MKRKCTTVSSPNKRLRMVLPHWVAFYHWCGVTRIRRAQQRAQANLVRLATRRLQAWIRGHQTRHRITHRLRTSRILEQGDRIQTTIVEYMDHESIYALQQCTSHLAQSNLMNVVEPFHRALRKQINQALDIGAIPSDTQHQFLEDCAMDETDMDTVHASFERRTMCRRATDEDRAWMMHDTIRGFNRPLCNINPKHGPLCTMNYLRQLPSFTLTMFKRWNVQQAIPADLYRSRDYQQGDRWAGYNILHCALHNRNVPFVRYLVLKCGMNPNMGCLFGHPGQIITPLAYAVYTGHVRMVSFLVNQGGVDVQATSGGRTWIFPKGVSAVDIAYHNRSNRLNRTNIIKILKDAGGHSTNMLDLRYFI